MREDDETRLTVGGLIKILSKMPQDLPVGRLGHFGEFHAMDEHDFMWYRPEYGHKGKECLSFELPDIGEAPD